MTLPQNTPESWLGAAGDPNSGTREALAAHVAGRHASTVQLVKYFAFSHLAGALRPMAMGYAAAALNLVDLVGDCPELTVALRKLVESKDAAVRAVVDSLSS